MKFNIAHATGLNTDQEAALVLSVNHDNDNAFLAVLKIVCDDAFTRGRLILSEASDIYYEGEGVISQNLTESYQKSIEKLSGVESFSLTVSAISGKVLYVLNNGQNTVLLRRSDKLSSLTQVAQIGQLVSGFLQERDRLCFSTDSLVAFLGDDLNKTLKLPLEEWEEETNMRITAVDLDYHGLAAMLIDTQPDVAKDEDSFQEVSDVSISDGLPGTLLATKFKFNLDIFKKIDFRVLIPSSGRTRIALGVILILIVIAGAGLQYKKNRDMQRNKEFTVLLQQSKDEFNTASGLITLNPQEAAQKLSDVKNGLEKALAIKPEDQEALELRTKLSEETQRAQKASEGSNITEFLDLGLIKKDFKAGRMSLSESNLLLLDTDTSTMVSLDVSKKSNKVLAGSDSLGKAFLASINNNFAFSYSLDKGVVRVDITNQKATSVAKKDKDLNDVADIAGFGSNVYVLDKSANQIWKYQPSAAGYADKKEYLTKDTKADFANAIRMQIESSIYVLKSGGEILRFTKGAKDNFSLSGLDKGIKDPKSIFTSSDTDYVYILDSGNSRLVVVDKKGVFFTQYPGDKFGLASDVAVDEKMKKVYLLDSGKIYTTDLK